MVNYNWTKPGHGILTTHSADNARSDLESYSNGALYNWDIHFLILIMGALQIIHQNDQECLLN